MTDNETGPDETAAEEAGGLAPRYVALAETLKAGIAAGNPPVGELLPTEHTLCEIHNVSRHTVREALRLLAEAGLIVRRRGAGTVVIASETKNVFAQRMGNVDDLMQYVRDARLQPVSSETLVLDPALARYFAIAPGGEFFKVTGTRGQIGQPPLALTDIYVRAEISPPVEVFVQLNGLVIEWIASQKGVAAARIDQKISAGALTEREAAALDCQPGAAALRTRRRYYDKGGRVIALSDSIHPGERFSYEMSLLREKDG